MSTGEERPDDEVVGNPEITFDWQVLPRGRTQVQARHGGRLFHCFALRLDDARERARAVREVITRARDQFGVEADPERLEAGLLAIIELMASQPAEDTAAAPVEYQIVEDQDDPDHNGLYAVGPHGPVRLCNFLLFIDRDIAIVDDRDVERRFEGRIILHGVTSAFTISSAEYGLGPKLVAAIFHAAGAKVQIHSKPEVLCRAISAISTPVAKVVLRNFGWTDAGDAYLTPSVRIDANGIHPTAEDDPVRVNLEDEQCARHLDLLVPVPGELDALKRHVVRDLLRLHDRRVTFALLAAAALAVLFRFVEGINRPALWLVGLTGGGKTFLAKLFMNLFGNFPIEQGSAVGSWVSTAYFLQREGYFFKDALFLIDDYKYELMKHADVVKLSQTYADGSARGRLRRDATANVSREIRGQLLSTGEAVPEHTPSATARTVVIHVPARLKDIERGLRCLARRPRYPALMAGFIHHLITQDRPRAFVARVQELQTGYYTPIAGEQNDLRIAANVALLGAAFEEFAAYLAPQWPKAQTKTRTFVETDLPALRDAMIASVKEQQPSVIFLATLRELIAYGRVRLLGWSPGSELQEVVEHRPVVGKADRHGGSPRSFEIATALALEAVQESLRRQGRPPLAVTERALLDQLAQDGKLLDREGRPFEPNARGHRTRDVNLAGSTRKVFRIAASELVEPRGGTGRPLDEPPDQLNE